VYDSNTGLIRFGTRDYDPGIGRWTSKDSSLFFRITPNVYAYVLADPVNKIDPTGLVELDLIPDIDGPIKDIKKSKLGQTPAGKCLVNLLEQIDKVTEYDLGGPPNIQIKTCPRTNCGDKPREGFPGPGIQFKIKFE
jgi:RHS repeat-associated protein